ncbi:hypothetical protein E7Z59_02950 [Robertkochia marina]|uniref:GxxExxY protein n=1 Tax=Robertkochia marina TaxID=1227945 RepID=A0A4S3M4Q5_9FLAO|nr:hypothetical protein [Robertkochia marina]THD69301.1 hypothetical protein E7Z59_02950 [Robertkochia marina]TRZ47440.1 hypothetical protein D3A96_01640 [Robertkochia marina]
MIALDRKNYQDFLTQTVNYLENRGFKNIKTALEGYESPKSFLKKGSDVSVTPDIVAEKMGIKHYFEISVKSEKPNLLKSKWMFLDALSKRNSSRFKIITTKGHYKFTNTMLHDLNLEKNMIKIN